jgi:hypothetical protein
VEKPAIVFKKCVVTFRDGSTLELTNVTATHPAKIGNGRMILETAKEIVEIAETEIRTIHAIKG